ncbi:MAG: outer membrane protein assembly factor BamB [Herbaspirillum sp.]
MHIWSKFVSVGVLAVLSGCSTLSSLNPFSHKAAPLNPPVALVDFQSSIAVRTVWSTSIGGSGSYTFSPALVDSSIFVAAADGSLARLDAATGRTTWRINAGLRLTAGVGADSSTVAVAGAQGVILAFDSSGKLRWKAQASSEVLSSPAVGGGLVVVRSLDNHVVAYDAESGVRKWMVQRTIPSLTLRAAPGIVIGNETAFVALPGGRLSALSLINGGPRWEVAVGDPRGTTELERISDTSGTPVLFGHEVCAVAYQGRIGCFDASTGSAQWVKDFSSYVGVGVDDRLLVGADDRGSVRAFQRASGTNAWHNDKLAFRRLSAPALNNGVVAVGDYQGYVHFLSRDTGILAARVATDGSAIVAAPQVSNDQFVFQTKTGTVLMLSAK